MIEIKNLLIKFNNLLLSKEGKKETVRQTISDVIGVDIKKSEVLIQNNSVYLNIKPLYKNEILLKKNIIDAKLEEAFGNKAPKNIF